ncbi:MucB/RseB C-terminal domain-containing protein [Polaromonas sp.]|uniref:MucB/RseB C-terminal domain-containing protein n=1 Tax=Polaromonas sp. TaxID=1869339 RepID=UPI00286B74B7|nr:MucB/RseB C-terminal domain-containing protein [Polaromonas sp.]
MKFKLFRLFANAGWALLAMNCVAAQPSAPPASAAAPATVAESVNINDWLMRMQEASRKRAYIGTFVVSSGGAMSSAKVWHVCEGSQQVERVETLTGPPRSIFRHNDQVLTFMPDHKLIRSEKRESLGLFPELIQSTDSRIADFYRLRPDGQDRVAGVEADIMLLVPKDKLRFGYRVWTEQKKGLVVKLQTLDSDGKVLEQAAFSELQLDASVKMDKLIQMMSKVDGYRVEKTVLVKTTASAEGWSLKAPVAGFKPISCYKRPVATSPAANGEEPLQWVFSDGLASVSIFVEPFDRKRHDRESSLSMGATQTLARQLDAYWVTVMGEVPMATLQLFANGLERKK